jgi:hypothetical protein
LVIDHDLNLKRADELFGAAAARAGGVVGAADAAGAADSTGAAAATGSPAVAADALWTGFFRSARTSGQHGSDAQTVYPARKITQKLPVFHRFDGFHGWGWLVTKAINGH